ncbi:MAG: tRNA lysidine(34) synthetase TilS [Spirochaetales bacterium]
MLSVARTIKQSKMFTKGDTIGVAVSGGIDSMSLLHFLNDNKEKLGIQVVAINIDHQMRENSSKDTAFVAKYCKDNGIECKKFKVDPLLLVEEQKLTKEEAARIARYAVFDNLIEKQVVTKIALGHHLSDQAETVLLNLFRGAGLAGVSGMDLIRDSYVRPMLYTDKEEIKEYAEKNKVPFVLDESNLENDFNRNYLRNTVIPLIKERWQGAENNIVNFSKIAKIDDDYINSMMNVDAIIKEEGLVKVPISYFLYKEPLVNRMLRYCFITLGVEKDIERKHFEIIKSMVHDAINGIKINLPNKITVHKEYDYITISAKAVKYNFVEKAMKSGVMNFKGIGKIAIKRTYDVNTEQKDHIVDVLKIPKNAVWRTRQEGDTFTKFGGGTKKLKDYLIDKKVPSRVRDDLPILVSGHDVLIVAGYDIADSVKVDETTKSAYLLKYDLNL